MNAAVRTFVNMASVTTATSEWIQFFMDAGIPAGLSVTYAVSFVDNRIQKNMLMDLSKEIMMDLGITVIGDIIAVLKHAKQVYRQDMCKMATDAISAGQTSVKAELRRTAKTPATRMIANALSHESPPNTPVCRSDNRLSVTVSNKQANKSSKVVSLPADEGSGLLVAKHRRVTAEMEGKYIVNMPKGTTARTRRILAQQAKKGKNRTSVFERLGAESKADTTSSSVKPTGVFSRLGREEDDEPRAAVTVTMEEGEQDDSDGEGSVLQYAGVLKGPAFSQKKEPAYKPVPVTLRRLGVKFKVPFTNSPAAGSAPALDGHAPALDGHAPAKRSVLQRLGKLPAGSSPPADTQDNRVTSTRPKAQSRLALGSSKVSSSTGAGAGAGGECLSAQMDIGAVSVFKRLGRKTT